MSASKPEGGALGGADELYREVILDHFKSPRNKGQHKMPQAQAEGVNPLCGDQISVTAVVEGDKIKDVKFDGHGCAISQSSASMMTVALKGKTIAEARGFTTYFKKIFGVQDKESKTPNGSGPLNIGDLEALEGVKKYPVRIKCALLSWNTFLESLKNLKSK